MKDLEKGLEPDQALYTQDEIVAEEETDALYTQDEIVAEEEMDALYTQDDIVAEEVMDAKFADSLTSGFKNDVMAAVKVEVTDVVKKTELVMEEMMDLKDKVENQMKDVRDDVKGQINQLEKTLSDQIGALKPLILEEKGETSKQPQDDGKRTKLGRVFRTLFGGNPPEPAGPDWVEQLSLDFDALRDPYNGLNLGTDTFPEIPWTPLSETPPKHLSYLPSTSSLVEYDPDKNVSVRPDLLIDEQGKHLDDNFQVQEAQGKGCAVNVKKYIGSMFEETLKAALEDKYEADADSERSVAPITGDYQCYHPMGLFSNIIGRASMLLLLDRHSGQVLPTPRLFSHVMWKDLE